MSWLVVLNPALGCRSPIKSLFVCLFDYPSDIPLLQTLYDHNIAGSQLVRNVTSHSYPTSSATIADLTLHIRNTSWKSLQSATELTVRSATGSHKSYILMIISVFVFTVWYFVLFRILSYCYDFVFSNFALSYKHVLINSCPFLCRLVSVYGPTRCLSKIFGLF